ncbi:MAG: hypothetical protein Q8R32_00585, partial [bacterium]|nr:hypothetical protein [bacterium]
SLALLFHFFADTLLHWNIYTDRHRWAYAWVAVDVLGALAVTYWLVPETFFSLPILAAILGGNLPDVWHGFIELWRTFKGRAGQHLMRKGWFYRFHEGLQKETLNPAKGLLWQVAFIVLAMSLL